MSSQRGVGGSSGSSIAYGQHPRLSAIYVLRTVLPVELSMFSSSLRRQTPRLVDVVELQDFLPGLGPWGFHVARPWLVEQDSSSELRRSECQGMEDGV